ncbi:Nif11-like leader peptide family natural product precursor [bacterium]|nr:Nif11-like leader peptide family natural product precursor [bacterium]
MSEEQLNAFLEKVKADTELQEKLNGAADADAVVEIAKAAGFSITAEDIRSMQSESVELSDEELEGAAGGWRRTGICGGGGGSCQTRC